MDGIEQFRRIAQPPSWALKAISGGRLRGMTDIKPAWRIQAMTEVYGLCGVGWKFEVVREWTEQGSDGQMFAFVNVLLYIRIDGEWSSPIPGNGGSMLIEKEKAGLHSNDEAFKMATTDALSSAMKMIGMAADVYAGQWTGSKYQPYSNGSQNIDATNITKEQITHLLTLLKEKGRTSAKMLDYINKKTNRRLTNLEELTCGDYTTCCNLLLGRGETGNGPTK